MKKIVFSAFFAPLLLIALSSCGQKRALGVKDFTVKPTKAYFDDIESTDVIDLYFSKATGNIPYIELSTTLNKLHDDTVYSVKKDAKNYTIVRSDDGATVEIDKKAKRMSFSDYDLFMKNKNAVTPLDLVCDYNYIKHVETGFETRGAPFYIEYGTFLIDIAVDKNLALIPLQTFCDVFLQSVYVAMLYNGNELFCVSDDSSLKNSKGEFTELGKKYYETQPAELDKDFADFNYRELVLNFQLNYGLKDLHGIGKFSEWFEDMGLNRRLSSTDSYEVDFALAEICFRYLGDIHSSFGVRSPYTRRDENEKRDSVMSPSLARFQQNLYEFHKTRDEFFP
ncbi:MAG: hypothetical protein IK094_00325, partial [Treponema sp.]|nr:hypothetical protein [Treponema sp.]